MLTALRGIRVLDLTRILAGPFGTMLLADLGAEVIKIERPDGGDDTRSTGPEFVSDESVYFMSVNRGKQSVVIDLSLPNGREVLHRLALVSDVLVENFRPGVAEKLGCDFETLRAINPRMIVCGMTAFGRTGPDVMQPAFDLILQARGGTMGITGEPTGGPVRMGPPMGDLAGGLYAAIAINAALYERTRTGLGQFIDLALLDCQASLLVYAAAFYLNAGRVLGPQGSEHSHAIPYQSFATKDHPITVAVFTERFWPGFCRALQRPEWIADPRFISHEKRRENRNFLIPAIESILLSESAYIWISRFVNEEVPASVIQTIDRVFNDPQILARNMIATMEHPTAGSIRAVGNPMKMGPDWEREVHTAPPRLAEHTERVLREIAGYDDARITELRALKVVT